MSSGFKLTVFGLVALFAIATYNVSVGVARKTNVANAPKSTSTKPTKKPGAKNLIKQIAIKRGNLPAPNAGQTYTVGYLFDLINKNNPGRDNPDSCSAFLVYFDNPSRSASGKDYGFDKSWVDKNRNTQVVLNQDPELIQKMISAGAYPDANNISTYQALGWADVFNHVINKFQKLLLYFTAVSPKDGQTYKLYIIDPWPQDGAIILNSNIKPEQACRAYRLLMDWNVG